MSRPRSLHSQLRDLQHNSGARVVDILTEAEINALCVRLKRTETERDMALDALRTMRTPASRLALRRIAALPRGTQS